MGFSEAILFSCKKGRKGIGQIPYFSLISMVSVRKKHKKALTIDAGTYKELSCRDGGGECHFLIRAETEDEVIALASEHACRAHHRCELTSEMRDGMKADVRSIWCEREGTSIPKKESRVAPGEWMED
jgi:predicted small metal-binding protein